MASQFIDFVNLMEGMNTPEYGGLFEAIRNGYSILESGTKMITDDGKVFYVDPPWTPDEDAMALKGVVPPGRTNAGTKKRVQRLHAQGIFPEGYVPRKMNARSMTIGEIRKYMDDRTPPDWVIDMKDGNWNAAKRYCDNALYKARKSNMLYKYDADNGECVKFSEVEYKRAKPYTVDECVAILMGRPCPTRTATQCYDTKLRIRDFINNKRPDLIDADVLDKATAYANHCAKLANRQSINDKWGDVNPAGTNLTIPSEKSTLAMMGKVPEGMSIDNIRERRRVGRQQAAIKGVRIDRNDPTYEPSVEEIRDYISEHRLDEEYFDRMHPNAKELGEFAGGSAVNPFNVPDDRLDILRKQMELQGVKFGGETPMSVNYYGKRAKEYDHRDNSPSVTAQLGKVTAAPQGYRGKLTLNDYIDIMDSGDCERLSPEQASYVRNDIASFLAAHPETEQYGSIKQAMAYMEYVAARNR